MHLESTILYGKENGPAAVASPPYSCILRQHPSTTIVALKALVAIRSGDEKRPTVLKGVAPRALRVHVQVQVCGHAYAITHHTPTRPASESNNDP